MPQTHARQISSGELRLDPGPQARRRSRLNWKCIALSFFTIVSLLGAFLVYKVLKVVLIPQDEGTRAKLYQDLSVPYNPSDVVQPLINSTQTFDIVATVWLRQDAPRESIMAEGGPILSEKAIYSETIFRGLRLEDTNIKTAVKLKIPTEIFKSPEFWSYDLRASFVLVPESPSPLDYAVNYTSWIPTGVNYPPMRSWPEGYSLSVADRVIDSYGTFLPLVVLNSVNSSCPPLPDTDKKDSDDINDSSDEIFDLKVSNSHTALSKLGPGWMYMSTKRRSALAHPYIVTRSHLRVVDMTRLFNRTEYEKQHRELRGLSCAGSGVNEILDWRFCWKHYETNQNSETRIKLRKKDPQTGENTTEWAYSPYLSLSNTAWGPMDLVKVPVNREKCENFTAGNSQQSQGKNSAVDEDFVNITWKIFFTGGTPTKLLFKDRMGLAASAYIDGNSKPDSDVERLRTQGKVDFINGLTGQSVKEGAHPRRQFAMTGIFMVIAFFGILLEIHYWFSRVSTVGISTLGGILIGCASLLDASGQVVVNSKIYTSFGFGWFITIVVPRIPYALKGIFMLKAALRAELHWYGGWIPGFRIAQPTHLERASERLEARISWVYKVMAFAMLAFVFTYYPDLRLLSGSQAAQAVGGTKRVSGLSAKLKPLLVSPSFVIGRALQLILNYRAKSFAGMYRLSAPLLLVTNFLSLAMAAPYVVGNLHTAKGVSAFMIIDVMYVLVLTWQSVRYAPVVNQEEGEDTK